MASPNSNREYAGVDRRCSERRLEQERRNLVRYESIGSDRRSSCYRRVEDAFWVKKS